MVDWEALIPTVYWQGEAVSSVYNLAVDAVVNSGTETLFDVQVEAPIEDTLITNTNDIDNVFIVNDASSLEENIIDTLDVGAVVSYSENVPVSMIHIEKIQGNYALETEYTIFDTANNLKDIDVEIKFYISPYTYKLDTTVEVTLSNDKRFTFNADIFSTKLATLASGINTDIATASGIVHELVTDIFSSTLGVLSSEANIFSTAQSQSYFGTEAEAIPGGIADIRTDLFSTISGINGIVSDIRTWSLFTGDFFLDTWSFTEASGTAWVDVVDYMWSIDTDNTYFMVDDVAVSGTTFSGIDNGYRVFYNPPADFLHDGPFTYTIHAQNSMSDILEQDYNLLYGYDVDFNRIVDWGPRNKIDILTKATNKAYCSNTAAEGFYFITRDFEAINLSSSILPNAPTDLGSEIRTQAKVFYYGGTYQVTVSGIRDYAGNELAPIVYSFTIENPIG